jgi:hypothetical protein
MEAEQSRCQTSTSITALSGPPSWEPLEDVLSVGKAQLALSLWNLFEIGSASDKAQRAQHLAFLMKFNPLWILERVEIQRQEVRAFLWKEKLDINPDIIQVFKDHLSEVESYYAGSETRIGLTPSQWINGVDFPRYRAQKELAPTALRQLQAHDAKEAPPAALLPFAVSSRRGRCDAVQSSG